MVTLFNLTFLMAMLPLTILAKLAFLLWKNLICQLCWQFLLTIEHVYIRDLAAIHFLLVLQRLRYTLHERISLSIYGRSTCIQTHLAPKQQGQLFIAWPSHSPRRPLAYSVSKCSFKHAAQGGRVFFMLESVRQLNLTEEKYRKTHR